MLQYEDLEKMESDSIVYLVHDDNKIFKLKLTGKNNQKCMLIHPEFYRIDVYKNSLNRFKIFASEKEAISYTEEINNLLRKKYLTMNTEEILNFLFDFYDGCYSLDYEAPYQEISQNELSHMKEVLWERLNLKK